MKRYQVLNEFKTYIKGKLTTFSRGKILTEQEVAAWPNFSSMVGTMLVEIPGADPAPSSEVS